MLVSRAETKRFQTGFNLHHPTMCRLALSYAEGWITMRDVDNVVTPSKPSMPKPAKMQSEALHGPKLAVTSDTSVRPPRPFTMSCSPQVPAWQGLTLVTFLVIQLYFSLAGASLS